MKQRFRLYRRSTGGRFYVHDSLTGKQQSLGTTDRGEATCLLHAKNEAARHPSINVQIARAYLAATDTQIGTRTWQTAIAEMTNGKQRESTRQRYERAFKEKAFDLIRTFPILETRPEHFLRVLEAGTVSTNAYLRRLHSFALAMTWLPWPVLTKQQWPELCYGEKRAITLEEHQAVLKQARTREWKGFLELAWNVGASQGDLASLRAEDVDKATRVISFTRQKTSSLTVQRYGDEVARVLEELPATGPLFPSLCKITAANRAARFAKAIQRSGISGVSLHSYRYAWAERAKTAGYPERYAQEALGHKSKAIHRAYAKLARVEIPPLEDFERLLNSRNAANPPSTRHA